MPIVLGFDYSSIYCIAGNFQGGGGQYFVGETEDMYFLSMNALCHAHQLSHVHSKIFGYNVCENIAPPPGNYPLYIQYRVRVCYILTNTYLQYPPQSDRELVSSHPDNLSTVLKGVVNNELGQYRTPSNMALISMMMHSWPDEAAKVHVVNWANEVSPT